MNSGHIEIGLREIYDKQCVVEDKVNALLPLTDAMKATERRVHELELDMAALKSAQRSVERFKLMLYPTWAAVGGALIAVFVK